VQKSANSAVEAESIQPREFSVDVTFMWRNLRNVVISDNPWIEQDRIEMRKLISTASIFMGAVLFGVGLLVYALVS